MISLHSLHSLRLRAFARPEHSEEVLSETRKGFYSIDIF